MRDRPRKRTISQLCPRSFGVPFPKVIFLNHVNTRVAKISQRRLLGQFIPQGVDYNNVGRMHFKNNPGRTSSLEHPPETGITITNVQNVAQTQYILEE